jgi:uncharacterized protein (TIGR02679 family)
MSDERLARLLGGSDLARLRARLARHVVRGSSSGPITLTELSERERSALAGLLGLPPRAARSLRLSLHELDAALAAADLASSLRSALEALDGPLVDRAAERAREAESWNRLCEGATHTALARHLAEPDARGVLKRLARGHTELGAALLRDVAALLARLPERNIPRSQLAAEVLGDAHGLDAGRPLSSLLLAVLRERDESERATWARAGVLVNELAAPVLALNLPASSRDPVGALAECARSAGLAFHLSLHALLRHDTHWQVAGRRVYVCENANLMAIAADRLATRCAPLVCTDGMPTESQRQLLTSLGRAGAHLRFHADFDWPGIRIANYVQRSFGATPWRMGANDYTGKSGRPLAGAPVQAEWDPALHDAMLAEGYVLEEEAVADVLLSDLEE